MALEYYCPKCNSLLNPNIRVILVAHFHEKRGIVLMSPSLGDYNIICDKGFCDGIMKGDRVEFRCPVCARSLTSPAYENFVELKVINTGNSGHHPCVLRFSRVSEEHATFLYDGETVKAFGDEAGLFQKKFEIEGHWGW